MDNASRDALPDRIAAKITVHVATSCWEWSAVRQPDGYGKVKWAGRMVSAHRACYELLVGPIPSGLEIDHLCRNRGCVNPSHMEPVTHAENVRRQAAQNPVRQPASGRLACGKGHVLAVVGVRPNESCAECCREAVRRARAKKG